MGISSMPDAVVIISFWLQNHLYFHSHFPWTKTLEISIAWSFLRYVENQGMLRTITFWFNMKWWLSLSQMETPGILNGVIHVMVKKRRKSVPSKYHSKAKKGKWMKHLFRILKADNLKTFPQRQLLLLSVKEWIKS